MDRATELQSVVKHAGGIVEFCKSICDDQDSRSVSEHELVDLIGKHDPRPGESQAQTFSRNYTSNVELRKAVQIAKAVPFVAVPVVVGGEDAFSSNDPSAAMAAYNELLAKAAEYRKANPALSEAQAFSAVFTSKENALLAQKAHQRPVAPANGMYEFPR